MFALPRPSTLRRSPVVRSGSLRQRFRPFCEVLEDRIALNTFNPVDVPTLIAAINSANTTPGGNTINLVPGMTYSLTVNQGGSGGNGLAPIAAAGGPLVINGNGATITRAAGSPNFRIFTVAAGANLTLNSVTLSNGSPLTGPGSAGQGGAIEDDGTLTINNSTLSGNHPVGSSPGSPYSTNARDGAIRVNSGATATINSSVISGNKGAWGGGIGVYGTLVLNDSTVTANATTYYGGGGVLGFNGANVQINRCTINNNQAGNGPGVYDRLNSKFTITNSTIANNTGTGSGGIIVGNGSMLTLQNCTVTGNMTAGAGGGIYLWNYGTLSTVTTKNSIIAGNKGAANGPDVFTINSGGSIAAMFCLIGDGTGATFTGASNMIGTTANPINPMLGALVNNGGVTQTMALLPGSPAIDAGSNALVPGGVTTDQRGTGFNRIIDGIVDMGAYEFQQPATTTSVTSSLDPSTVGQTVTFTATVTANAPGSNAVQGTVTFLDNGTPLATVTLSGGSASFSTATLTGGSHTITAQYSGFTGNNSFSASMASLTQTVALQPTTTALTVSTSGAGAAQNVTLKATIKATVPAGFTLTGTVSFFLAGQLLGTVTVSGLTASFTLPIGTLPTGANNVTASYSGDVNFLPSSSAGIANGLTSIIATGADAGGVAVVNAYDPVTGALKFTVAPFGFGFRGGVRVAVGDINGDGVQDVICAAGPGGLPLIVVYDGRNGNLIESFFAFGLTSTAGITNAGRPVGAGPFTGGMFVAAGDVNGDGHDDIIVGADAGGGPQVEVFDGATGAVLASFFAFGTPSFMGGVRVAAADVNGDGRADIICAAGPGGGPQLTVYDGATFQPIANHYALGTLVFSGGLYVAAGNINGMTEIVIGAGAGGGPQVQIYDGSLNILGNFYALAPTFTGGVRVGLTSSRGGPQSILTAAGPGGGPQVEAFDSSTLAALSSFFAYNPTFTGGVFVA
jgi:hypothetical protein